LQSMENWLTSLAKEIGPRLAEEPRRLLEIQAYRAAVISAMTFLEATLRERLAKRGVAPSMRAASLMQMLQTAQTKGVVNASTIERVNGWMKVRNIAVHTLDSISASAAQEIVEGVLEIVGKVLGDHAA